jgi:nitrogen fixation protein FixH
MNASAAPRPRRSPWPYAIAAYFAVAIIGIALFITWAVGQNMDLVRSDYYEQEILFQQQIDAVNRTRPFAKEIAVNYNPAAGTLLLRLPAAHLDQQLSGTAHLYRPSDAKLDRAMALRPDIDGRQVVAAGPLASGLWRVRLDWTAGGETYHFEQSVIIGE